MDLYNGIKKAPVNNLEAALKDNAHISYKELPKLVNPAKLGLKEDVTLNQYYESLLNSAKEAGFTKEEIEGKVSI